MAAMSLPKCLSSQDLIYGASVPASRGWKRPTDMSLLHTVLITELVYISCGKSAEVQNAPQKGMGERGSVAVNATDSFLRIIFSHLLCVIPICVKAICAVLLCARPCVRACVCGDGE